MGLENCVLKEAQHWEGRFYLDVSCDFNESTARYSGTTGAYSLYMKLYVPVQDDLDRSETATVKSYVLSHYGLPGCCYVSQMNHDIVIR